MSRSYKKYAFCKDNDRCKWGKRYGNKVVRKTKEVPNGTGYRKMTERMDFIYDYHSNMKWKEFSKYFGDDSKTYLQWYKFYKMK